MNQGRGRHHSLRRLAFEALSAPLYRGDRLARLAARLPGALEVRLVEQDFHLLPPGLPPLRLAFVSDLHLGPTTPRELVERAFSLLARLRPDALVLGGDFFYRRVEPGELRLLARLVEAVPARLKLGVWGNHDLWLPHPRIERALARVGLRFLCNQALPLPAPWEGVALVGLDDPWAGELDAERALAAAGGRLPLVLCHSPDGLPAVAGRVPLYLCGHTHGGQLAWPGGHPLKKLGGRGEDWPWGRYRVWGTELYVSRGIGNVALPLRWNAPSELLLARLLPPPRPGGPVLGRLASAPGGGAGRSRP